LLSNPPVSAARASGRRALRLVIQAAGQASVADEPVADPPAYGRRGQVLPRLGGLAAVEADDGGDAEVRSRRRRVP